jgi:hypothetical protein
MTTTAMTLKAGHIFFCTPTGIVSKHVGLGNGAGSQQLLLSDISSSGATGEGVVEGVLSTATKCYIISNVPTAVIANTGNLEGSDINDILAKVVYVAQIIDYDGLVANVPMLGEGNVDMTASGSTAGSKSFDATVTVAINALAARLQVGTFTGVDKTVGTVNTSITKFKIKGIYITHTNDQMTLGSVVSATPEVDRGQSTTAYTKSAYGTDLECLVDEFASPKLSTTTTPPKVSPAAGKTWNYNLFPNAAIVPHIVVKLSDIYISKDGAPEELFNGGGDHFLTLTKFSFGSAVGGHSAGDLVTKFEANNIYTLGDIQFNFTHLSVTPEPTPIDVLVKVTMAEWVDNPIVWEEE